MGTEKVGDVVWYKVGNGIEEAVIIALTSETAATIRIQTGPQLGHEIEVPWGMIEPKKK
jgi:hypothetical protein